MGGSVTELAPRIDAPVEALRKARRHRVNDTPILSTVEHEGRREARLDLIQAGKSKLWQINLRLSQLVNGIVLCLAGPFIVWQRWAWWATGVAAGFTVVGMWTCARWMGPREQRLCRHMATLARRRRSCVQCGYRLCGLENHQCPECGLAFDPADSRHVLTRESVRMYSSRARIISTVVIVCVLFWVSALAQSAAWPIHVAIGAVSLVAFHGLHLFWKHQARSKERRAGENELPPLPRCLDCEGVLWQQDGREPNACPTCSRALTYGDVFIRPDVRRLSDRRITSLQYQSLILRWIFLMAVCGGLTALVFLDDLFIGLAVCVSRSRKVLPIMVGAPILAWVIAWTLFFRSSAKRLQRRLRILFAAIVPRCRRCGCDVGGQAVGSRCSNCGKTPA